MTDSYEHPILSTADGVSPSAHPSILDIDLKLLANDDAPLGRALHVTARAAMKEMYESLVAQSDAYRAAMASAAAAAQRGAHGKPPSGTRMATRPDGTVGPTLTPDLADQLRDALDKSYARTGAMLAAAQEHVLAQRKTIADAVAKAVDHPPGRTSEGIAHSAEIRAVIRAMPAGERVGFVQSRIRAGDRSVAYAVLSSSPILSGITQEQLGMLATTARTTFAPSETTQLTVADRMIARMGEGAAAYKRFYDRIRPKENPRRPAAIAAIAALAGQ